MSQLPVKFIVINPKDVNYIGDINEIVRNEYTNKQRFGVITHKELDPTIRGRLSKIIINSKYMNWLYIDVSFKELSVFSINVPKFREVNKEEKLADKVARVLNTKFEYIYTYPIYNMMLDLEPYYPKSKRLMEKQEWNWGKLGKKEIRKKYMNMRKKILYSNLKR